MPSYRADSLMYRILDFLEEGALSWDVMLERLALQAPHYKGAGWLSKEKYKQKWDQIHEKERRIEEIQKKRKERIKFSKILSRLKESGLIIDEQKDGHYIFSITDKGRKKREEFDIKLAKEGNEWMTYKIPKYQTKPSQRPTVVIFDIEEKYKRKRNWLRYALISMGFVMLQKSVWIAFCKLPQDFIDTLRDLEILDSVVIFTVFQSGNINLSEKLRTKN